MRRGALALVVACAATLVGTMPADAADRWTVSLTGAVTAAVARTGDGGLTFAATRGATTVLAPAPLGVRTKTADLTRDLRFLRRTDRIVDEHYAMTTGKQLRRHARAAETTLAFEGAGGTRLDVVVRAAADGVAYRYVLPGTGPVTITGEASSFTPPATAPAWLLPYSPNYENVRVETTASTAKAGDYGFPSLFDTGDGTYTLLTESDVDGRYSGARLTHIAGTTDYAIKLADASVTATGPFATPWRVAITGDLSTVTASTLVDDLAPPSKLADTSWIRPGKVAWSWLSEHDSPGDPVRQKQYADFAARNGWPYLLIDEGWDASWVPDVVRYARARGVEVILWFRWTTLDTAAERAKWLPLVKSWGAAGIKVDFMDSDTQARFRFYDDIAAATAQQRLMINFHGATIPRGLQRTWPHVMSFEAVRGAEQFKTRAATNTMFPFTRNVVGSMDYTPTAFVVSDRDTTDAHEVATFFVYESGWQHGADKPENYEARPEALRTLDQLPTVWDETRLLSGRPGQEAVFAKRSGERWFVGGIEAGPAKTVDAPLDFLGHGRWLADTLRDGPAGLLREKSAVSAGGRLSVPVAKNGGFVTVLCPAWPGRTTCDEEIRQVPATSLSVTPETAEATAGTTVEVKATFRLPAGAPLLDVELGPAAPAGWTVTGRPVFRPVLFAGQPVSGTWRFTAAAAAAPGTTDLPIAATYRFRGRSVHVEDATSVFVPPPVPVGTAQVSALPFLASSNGWGPVERDQSNGDTAEGDGRPLTIGGTVYAHGLGTNAPSSVTVWLGGACTAFSAVTGVDDEVTEEASVGFRVLGDDGRVLAETPVLRPGDGAHPLTADVTGVRRLTLQVTDGGDGKDSDHGDWADAQLTCAAP
ncbi:glycoside hydrolase family 97 catalytic domain-containing protein [Amycolatopsis sp., V23-08]|uniref:Glycoside hydrolase family 97 catalytic domain-containing protein n=1 Tax=Amycolatopsis heterodermiae TaxID=3110235 RepID=A0ABU5RHT7_9PSEU|nr:glycoside hydrolase family 97 catalytic domain-containing protein [Amycolatopsis sp., V23-08]MEA5365155.1 glycoside hydrolase family 97 catalytic domain-containing protein [Amycolatopsis sp., V23-08]